MNPPSRTVSCAEWQRRISDELDTPMPDPALGAHLAGCAACRAFQQTLAALDSQLTTQARRTVLPLDFKARLLERTTATPRLTPVEVAARQEQLERAHRAALSALERSHLVPQGRVVLKVLTATAALVLAAMLALGIGTAVFDAVSVLRETGVASRVELVVFLGAIAALTWWKRRSLPLFRWRLALR